MKQTASSAKTDMGNNDEKRPPKLNEFAATRIGQRLRAEFDSVVQEPVPDRFKQLLDKLEDTEATEEGKSANE